MMGQAKPTKRLNKTFIGTLCKRHAFRYWNACPHCVHEHKRSKQQVVKVLPLVTPFGSKMCVDILRRLYNETV